jgi:hypothetical protein
LIKGSPETALMRPDAVLITENMAKKYFGKEDPLGKTLKKNNGDNVTVTGVLANIPSNSHLQFDFILPVSSIAQSDKDLRTSTWQNFNYYAYIQLDKNFKATPAAIEGLNKQINKIFKEHVNEAGVKS